MYSFKKWYISVSILLVVFMIFTLVPSKGQAKDKGEMSMDSRSYEFNGTISREVLDNYLSRSITHQGLTAGYPEGASPTFEDDLRSIINMGAKFIGRAAYTWAPSGDEEGHFQLATERAKRVHEEDPEIILQSSIFETTYTTIEQIPIPDWVFEEFGLQPEQRNFDYERMLFEDGRFVNHWGPGASVPDMSRLETKMWFFYRAARYIDAGYEAIHMGQVYLMGANDPGYHHWFDVIDRIRQYANKNARRHLVLLDAHTHGIKRGDELLFDFHSFPMRPKEVLGSPEKAMLEVNHLDSIYTKSLGGKTPSGWWTDSLPYIVEVDNYGGKNALPGVPDESLWTWGYDEIAWFSRQPEEYRNKWLKYAWDWVRVNDSVGWVQFPGRRTLGGAPIDITQDDGSTVTTWMYKANMRSDGDPLGFGQENTIKEIWKEHSSNEVYVQFKPIRNQVEPGSVVPLHFSLKNNEGVSITNTLLKVFVTKPNGEKEEITYRSQPNGKYKALLRTDRELDGVYFLNVEVDGRQIGSVSVKTK